jgi:ketosteroid isomerase-like protein
MRVERSVEAVCDTQRAALAFFDALEHPEQLMDVFTEDATWTVWGEFPFSGTHSGRDAVVNGFHADAGRLFVDDGTSVLTVKGLIGEGPTVAVEFEYVSPTAAGKQYHNHYVEVFEVASGKIAHVREYMDTLHLKNACLPDGS